MITGGQTIELPHLISVYQAIIGAGPDRVLAPGAYTVIIRGVSDTTGIAGRGLRYCDRRK
jgi:hypothetical protein